MVKRFALFSGTVISRDGDLHKIMSIDLLQLYKVNPKECIFIDREHDLRGVNAYDYICLFPKSDGGYYNASETAV